MGMKKYSTWLVWTNHIRAWKIYWKYSPNMFISNFLYALVNAILPYVNIWLSAQFINELAGNCNSDVLLGWIIKIILCTSFLELVKAIFLHWKTSEEEKLYYIDNKIYMDKMVTLDFADIDRSYVYDLHSFINQNRNYAGWGTYQIIFYFQEMVTSFIQIIGGIGLSISLFLLPVKQDSYLSFLNSPLCIIGFLCLMICISLLSPIFATKGSSYFSKSSAEGRLGNRLYEFYEIYLEIVKKQRMYVFISKKKQLENI